DLADVGVTHSEALGVLLRRQPAMVIGRAFRLLGSQQFFEIGLLACRRRKSDRDVGYGKGRRYAPLIIGGLSLWIHVPDERRTPAVICGFGDTAGLRKGAGRTND